MKSGAVRAGFSSNAMGGTLAFAGRAFLSCGSVRRVYEWTGPAPTPDAGEGVTHRCRTFPPCMRMDTERTEEP